MTGGVAVLHEVAFAGKGPQVFGIAQDEPFHTYGLPQLYVQGVAPQDAVYEKA